jgi:hypothetical protein
MVWYGRNNPEADDVIDPKFHSTQRYHDCAEPAALLADLKELRRRSEAARRRRKVLIACLVIFLVLDLVVCLSTGGLACIGGIPAGILAAVFLGIGIYRASRMILDERRRKLAVAVVRALACDVPPRGKMDLSVAFGKYQQDRHRTTSGPAGNYSSSAYRQPWLAVTTRLADGSQVELGADLVARVKERAKTKGRKKVKEDLCEHVSLSLRVPRLPERAAQRWPELLKRAPMPEGAYLHRALVKGERLGVEVRTHRQVRVTNKGSVVSGGDVEQRLAGRDTLLMPVLAAYAALQGCRSGG